ncbi:ATP-dependent RNA helicase RhlE [Oxalobacteraceae bacterium GrIS 2.11]
MSFDLLNLHPALLRAILQRGYQTATAIQTSAVPVILQGKDLIASAQTGSGKTAAFCLPLLQLWSAERVSKPRKVHGLILVPTRELATQVGDTLLNLAAYLPKPIKLAVVFGGISINPQMLHLRGGADIVIATPGRLLDLIRHNALSLSSIKTLVLDEADRLLDLGFADELAQILALLPEQRQTILFSATFPEQVTQLSEHAMHDPVRIDIEHTPVGKPNITQRAIAVDMQKRTELLRHLISSNDWTRILVFTSSRYSTELVAMKLRKSHILAEPFHGELGQGKRNQVLSDFKTKRIQVVVATDLAARGIDIPNLPVVINYDPPRSSDDYTHRIGRTGRAGAAGLAINFVCASNDNHYRFIEKSQHIQLEREHVAGFEPLLTDVSVPVAEKGVGGIKGSRPSKKDKLRALALAHPTQKPS